MKKRVMVVENDKEILDLISIVLEDAGYEPSLHINEQGIFEHIVEINPDAILLDIIRPTIKGTELCRQIKAAENTKHIPVIVLSTHSQIEKVKTICADEIVEKPFDIEELLAVLNEQLSAA